MNDEKITAVIVEDDDEASFLLGKYLLEITGIELLSSHSTSESALPAILKSKPGIVFLDVELPGKSGIDLLEDLGKAGVRPCVIFTTAHNQYAIRAIRHAAFDYLLKPIDRDDLLVAVTRFRNDRRQQGFEQKVERMFSRLDRWKKISLNTQAGLILLDPAEIVYCMADWNYTHIFLLNDRKETVTMNIGKLVEVLPPWRFIRISRSIVINIAFLDRIDKRSKKCILVAGNKRYELPVPAGNVGKIEKEIEGLCKNL